MLMETSEGVKHFVLYHPKTDRASPFLKVKTLDKMAITISRQNYKLRQISYWAILDTLQRTIVVTLCDTM